MRVEVIFDTVCPWCYIGKRRLERALQRRPAVRADITWRPFLLNPDMPDEGIARAVYLERKFGGPARVARMLGSLREAGRQEGIGFDFDAITRTPNSLDSHRLVRFAAGRGLASPMVDALFDAYFQHGIDIGSRRALIVLAEGIGLDGAQVETFLASPRGRADVYGDNAYSHRLSINGVPCFIFDGAFGISGAQDPDILTRLIDLAAERTLEAPFSAQRTALTPGLPETAG